ncbi:MAG: hypothetical protein QN173_10805 [Armatimonadota bacterium]|nr:hypothetical protein [Armatimonadota bacterium]MDR7438149.1 hypothetical protein [Armatimonadota bacterium]MDR7471442.1 hypothetical protein [Armatimonadota bacterium]MDR7508081.1 hypothetical protein [Armatimonadota bacterium]MDR7516635.1 hypothetical protein [Armatimonadota bacterium]
MVDEVDILLVIPDRRLRAYTLAEALEQGYEVIAVPRARHAQVLLRTGVTPRLLVIDLVGVGGEDDATRDLLARPPEGLLTLVGALERADVAHLPPERVMLRPFTVGQLVARIRQLLSA